MTVSVHPAVEPPDITAYRRTIRRGRPHAQQYARLLGIRTDDPLILIRHLRKGLRYAALDRFQHNSAFSIRDLADTLQIPLRTLHRRKAAGRLHPDESDRLVRTARVFGRALELCEGDAEAARRWLTTRHRALGNATPLSLVTTEIGAREVEDLIGRLEHGIPS